VMRDPEDLRLAPAVVRIEDLVQALPGHAAL
jgi:hypothetical protein